MVSSRKKRQSNRRLRSNLDDLDEDIIIGNAANERRDSIVVSEGIKDQDSTVGTSSNELAVNESTVNVKTLERCVIEKTD